MELTNVRTLLVRFVAPCLLTGLASVSPAAPESRNVTTSAAETIDANQNRSLSYHIGAGDVLQILVAKEPDASVQSAVVRSDGVIAVPLVKEVEVAGLTPAELEQKLTKSLAKFIREPDVTVVVKEVHSEKIYMIGAVKKEGPITLHSPITVLQAVAEAGGLTDFAKRNRIYILRTENEKQVRIPFNYQALIKGGHMEENIVLRPGDTVVVPQ